MDTSPKISLVGLLLLIMMMSCNMILSAHFHDYVESCEDKLLEEWSDDDDDDGDSDSEDGKKVEIVWRVADGYTEPCPYQDTEEDMDDEENNLLALKCNYYCRINLFAVTGSCNREGKCECCGFGGNFCNQKNGIWSENTSYDEATCDDIDCDTSCVTLQDPAVGACFDGPCQCCFP